MYDFHMHTAFSDDGSATIDEMAEAAIAANLTGIAITDHLDPFYPDTEMPFMIEIDDYEKALTEAVPRYAGRLDIAAGIEIGMQSGPALEVCEETVSRFSYDFVIGSVHASKDKCIHLPEFTEGKTLGQIIEDYYTDLIECIKAYKNYDVLGHLNVIDRYAGGYAPVDVYLPYAEEALKIAIADGKGIEINTSSYRYGMGSRTTPTKEILDLYVSLGGEILTTGSDAHKPCDVGSDIEKGEQMILSSGLSYVCTYKNRTPVFHKIG
ncbi:MAG: histidinol-phosphatase HisJ family protein [Clostridiales Family XIII bacterium]|jgi:histidinol-phosphatase (PHP family)|nr:histidinol-phosphatase HisJ family protein [Clostridiales Family XIII bacterium]